KQSEQFGRKVATADEARKIMKIGVWYNTVEETLFNLGLPPNRPEGYKGFLAYDNDGRLPKAAEARTNPTSVLQRPHHRLAVHPTIPAADPLPPTPHHSP